ncbi:hypothetical protein F4803DRAFT_573737 [Xylaria telfairii]|nr:hypothetical protein F4803DRAFT_573737 [Xylaria telfairii]
MPQNQSPTPEISDRESSPEVVLGESSDVFPGMEEFWSVNINPPEEHAPEEHTPEEHTPEEHTPEEHTPEEHTPEEHACCEHHHQHQHGSEDDLPSNGDNSESGQFTGFPEITNVGTWRDLAMYITAFHPSSFDECEELFVDVHIDCDICQERRLQMPDWLDSTSYENEKWNSEPLSVLPCGHFFGYECLRGWMKMNQNEGVTPTCPKCRFPLVYPKCQHALQPRALRDLGDFDPPDLPYLVPYTRIHKFNADGDIEDITTRDPAENDAEHNFGVPDYCRDCARTRLIRQFEQEHRENPIW